MRVSLQRRRWSALLAVVALLIGLGAAWAATAWYEATLLAERRAQVEARLGPYATSLTTAVDRRLALLNGLAAFVRLNPEAQDLDRDFAAFAGRLAGTTAGIESFLFIRDGVIRWIEPLAGNESIAGQPIGEVGPDALAEYERASQVRGTTIGRPRRLPNGALGVVAHQSVFDGDRLLGVASVVLDIDTVLNEAGLTALPADLAVLLRDSAGAVFYERSPLPSSDVLVAPIDLPDNDWDVYAGPVDGWAASIARPLWIARFASLAIVGLGAVLVFLVASRQAFLERAVSGRTSQLSKANAELVAARTSLEQRVEARTRQLTTLLDVSQSVAATLEVEPLLRDILAQIAEVVDYRSAAVLLLARRGWIELRHYAGPSGAGPRGSRWRWEQFPHLAAVVRGQSVVIPDVSADDPLAMSWRAWSQAPQNQPGIVKSWMGVPLRIGRRPIGALTFNQDTSGAFDEQQAGLALIFANFAAIALENARLYAQAQDSAALEERQRLARELHDSVSQALFGIALGARTARAQLDRDPAKAAEPLDYVLTLAEAGIAEMRALIFELRPESLEQEGLVAALQKQAASLTARHGITVTPRLGAEPAIGLDAKQTLYRIGQEAMHNIVKHARATQVDLDLIQWGDQLTLTVADNGIGFDPQGDYPGHLGLHSMRERAEALGGSVHIASTPGSGARLTVTLPLRPVPLP